MSLDLSVERLTVKRGDLEDVVLQRLRGTVFHVTSGPAVAAIIASGVIRSNQDGRFAFTWPQSQNNYGRRRGYVCLFDLRDVPEDQLRDALHLKLYFLKPTRDDPVFLFVDPSEYGKLIPWTVAKGSYKEVLIPYVESWYPSDLPVSALAGALAVTVEPDDADSAFRWRMREFRRDNKEILEMGLVIIEASTLGQLKERVEEWVSVAQEGGLEVDEGWDEDRVERSEAAYRIRVHAKRDHALPERERCPKCGAELHPHAIEWERILVRGRPFIPAELDCMSCGYSRLVLDPADDSADAPLLQQLTPEEWDSAYGRLMEVWRKSFDDDGRYLSAYRHLYGDDETLLTAWRKVRG